MVGDNRIVDKLHINVGCMVILISVGFIDRVQYHVIPIVISFNFGNCILFTKLYCAHLELH